MNFIDEIRSIILASMNAFDVGLRYQKDSRIGHCSKVLSMVKVPLLLQP